MSNGEFDFKPIYAASGVLGAYVGFSIGSKYGTEEGVALGVLIGAAGVIMAFDFKE